MTPTCIVTGGSAGIGLATALHFGHQGYQVVICGRQARDLQSAQEQIASVAPAWEAIELDLTRPDAPQALIKRAMARFGRVDVLVNNAGYAPLCPVEEMKKEDFDQALAINVQAVFHTTQAVWPIMKNQGGGTILNISSLASVDPFPGFSVYGACKAWVNLFTKATAEEGKPVGIRVYSVGLGAVETRMLRGAVPDYPRDQALAPEEVARFLFFLCQDMAHPASGQTLFFKK